MILEKSLDTSTDFAELDGALPEPSGPVEAINTRLNIAVLLWPSFPLMSLAGLVESLRHAGDHGDQSQHRYTQWKILGPPSSSVKSSCGVPVEATSNYVSPVEFDYLFVIGGLLKDISTAPQSHRDYIQLARNAGTPIVGVCTGSFVLAQEKVLVGKAACIHPYHQNDFETAFPGHRTVLNKDYEIQDNTITVLGGTSILPLMSEIIRNHLGCDQSAKMVHQMTHPGRVTINPFQPDGMLQQLEISDPRIQKALVMIDAKSTQNLCITELAQSLGLSARHFLRLFRQQVGKSPKDYQIDTKLKAAIWLLRNTSLSITSIAYSTGFSSGASLAQHCQKRQKNTPRNIRLSIKG